MEIPSISRNECEWTRRKKSIKARRLEPDGPVRYECLRRKGANTVSGNIEVRIDPRGNPQGESMGIVMGHELLGHGLDLMFKGTSSEHSAINTENLIRLDLGLTLRPNQIIGPWPNDPER